ncbi:MAG: ATP-binding cassette domain-containing protein [Rhodospirillales bacterium]|nr:ATP-binding cassette domain-containing protein [Rhodospirillales bacterium]
MTSRRTERGKDPFLRTIRFVAGQWRRQLRLALVMAAGLVLIAAAELALPLFAGQMVDALADGARSRDAAVRDALNAFAAILGLGGALVVLRYGLFKGIVRFTLRMMSEVAHETFWRVQRFSTDWHANSFAGATVRKLSRGMWAFDLLNDTVLVALWPSLVVLLGATLLFGWHWPLMGLAVGVGSVLYVLVTVKLSLDYVTPATRRSNAWDSRLGGALADAVSCNPVVKAFGAEAREDVRFSRVLARWRTRTWVTWNRATLTGIVQQAILMVLRIVVIGLALLFWWQGTATLGDVTFVLTAYGVINGYLRDIGHHVHNVQRSTSDLEELVAFHDEALGVENRPDAGELVIARGDIQFEQVRFRYPALDRQVYDGLSIRIPAGQRVGLVGRSGSGKTTFVKLVQRLYDLDGGRITIDGQDIAGVTQESLRRQLAIVQQEPLLFHRSLADNIAYGRPDATVAEIEEAARLAHADAFIDRLPQRYATLVGERGVKLSGGERQRVALARTFLANSPILILDEATSSLDSESEALIQDAMHSLMRGRTTLVIAHRLSTVRELDRILVFDHGRIVEDGNHAALLRLKGGIYRRLVERQAEGMGDDLAA